MNQRIVISEDLAVISAPDGSVLLEVVEAVDEGDVAMIKLIRHEALGLALSILSTIQPFGAGEVRKATPADFAHLAGYGLSTFDAGQVGPELTYCPFCGGEAHYVQSSYPSGDYKVQVQCVRCDATTAATATKDRVRAYAAAARHWNGRTDGPDYSEPESDEDNRDGEPDPEDDL